MKSPLLALLLLGGVLPVAAGTGDTFLLRGATVHTVSGADIPDGSVLVKDGRIAEVGAKLVAPKGVRVIDVKGLHVYPGLIDAATSLGVTEIGSVRETNDTTDIGTFKPQLRIAIAFNPASEHLPVTRANGITTALVQPAGGIIPGQAALMHMDGWTIEDMALRPSAAMRLDYPAIQEGGGQRAATTGSRSGSYAEAKKRCEAQVRELNEFFEAARRYQKAKAAGAAGFRTDLKLEAMLPVLERKLPVLVRAEKERTIREALEFAEKQKVRMILQHGGEAWKLAGELKTRNVPVVLGRTYSLPDNEDDPYDRGFATPAELFRAGVRIAFATYGPGAGSNPCNLPYEAAAAVPFGLPPDEALKAVTLYPAEIFGVADQVGSIDRGKLADLIVTDGDPLETRTQVKQMFIQGRPVDLGNKHKRLYEKYLNRP